MTDLPSFFVLILTLVLVIFLIVTGAPIKTEYGDEIILPPPFYNESSIQTTDSNANNFSTPEGKEKALALLHRSDVKQSTPAGERTRLQMPWVVWISVRSWVDYKKFSREQCRFIAKELPNFDDENFYYKSDYFRYEDSLFHLKLRHLLFPESSRGDLKTILRSEYMPLLDYRFFQMPLKSQCTNEADDKKTAEASELSKFEDVLINRLSGKKIRPSLSMRYQRYEAWIAAGKPASEFWKKLH